MRTPRALALVLLAISFAFGEGSDDRCLNIGGQCLDYRYYKCTAGYVGGYCDGDNNRKCCKPCDQACLDQEAEWEATDTKCTDQGGECLDNSNFCDGSYSGGLCSGPSSRQCCIGIQTPDPEFRALFIASAFNVDWPTNPGESSSVQKEQLLAFLDTAEEMNMNAVMFQIRPAADALYDSPIEPWSRFLSGSQGTPPSPYYDPLEFAVDEAHRRGIELHVWLNPYRGGIQTNYDGLAANHVCNTLREYCYVYDKYLWLDPGAPEVADQLISVIEDIVTRYDVDGVHFDDYFYPYPDDTQFPDLDTYNQYGGGLSRDDWRRDNVNKMVERCYNAIHAIKSFVKFSISPFGIYRPGEPGGMPSSIAGLDPYSEQYADTKLWFERGWVDFMAPQLYWAIDPPAQSYPVLLDWWIDDANPLSRYVYAATGVYKMDNGWPVSEITNQVALSRNPARRSKGSLGNIHYSAKYFRDNVKGIKDEFKRINPNPVSLPIYPWIGSKYARAEGPEIALDGRVLRVNFGNDGNVRNWAVHKKVGRSWVLVKTLPVKLNEFELAEVGEYVVQGKNPANEFGEPVFFTIP